MKMTTFLARFSDGLMELMVDAAAKHKVSVAKLIRMAVIDFLHDEGYDVSDTRK